MLLPLGSQSESAASRKPREVRPLGQGGLRTLRGSENRRALRRSLPTHRGGRGPRKSSASRAVRQYARLDSLSQYLREISRTPLLAPEREAALSRRSQRGDFDARQKMVEANLRLVVKLAGRYARRGFPIEDLISEGNIGLIRAAELFRPDEGPRFATYASWWIRQCMARAILASSPGARVSIHTAQQVSKLRAVSSSLTQDLDREPDEWEVAKQMGTTVNHVKKLSRASESLRSLGSPCRIEVLELGVARVEEREEPSSPDSAASAESDSRFVKALLKTLNWRERRILALRYGLVGGHRHTLAETGRIFGLSRERVRQIEQRALWQLRRRGALMDRYR